jgi:hypothetical protein
MTSEDAVFSSAAHKRIYLSGNVAGECKGIQTNKKGGEPAKAAPRLRMSVLVDLSLDLAYRAFVCKSGGWLCLASLGSWRVL